MDKIVDGHVFTKARFLRTTCKRCGKPLSKDQVIGGAKFHNKNCRKKWIKNPRPKRHVPVVVEDDLDEDIMGWDSHKDSC